MHEQHSGSDDQKGFYGIKHVGYWLTLLTLKCIKIFQSVTQEKW